MSVPPQPKRGSSLPACVDYWKRGEPVANFGDCLSEMLYQGLLTGSPHESDAQIRLIGSVISRKSVHAALQDGYERVVFWGCGMRHPFRLGPYRKSAEFRGVRGIVTRDVLGLPRGKTPIGDPALLLPRFYRPRPVADMAGQSICIPHFNDRTGGDELRSITGADRVLRMTIKPTVAACRRIVDNIAAAEFVLTGALHGAIVAYAYGVPFAYFAGTPIDVPFKWVDFSSSIRFDCDFVRTVGEGKRFSARNAKRKPGVSLDGLLKVAPFPLKQ